MEEITAFPLGKVAVLDLLTDREQQHNAWRPLSVRLKGRYELKMSINK
ncbi:MAG TPA: hypothetical protein PLV70_03530 [Flavobacteriales bacterium]|nr:hypothetical protein [Flavobacteriales bacterium]HRP81479.1 hypothetical protein [Flavobacteriales bacterium]HRQ84167.1 hypothetical protein [Flavobacteriales bacterium]